MFKYILYLKCLRCRKKNDIAGLARTAAQIVARNPKDVQAWQYLGYAHMRKGRYSEALSDLGKALALNPAQAMSSYYQGQIFKNQQRLPEALTAYRQAIANRKVKTGHLSTPWIRKEVECLERLSREDEILPTLDQYLAQGPAGNDLWELLLNYLSQQAAWEKIIDRFSRLEFKGRTASLILGLGQAYQAMGRLDEAAEVYLKAGRLSSSPELFFRAHAALVETGKGLMAEKALNLALKHERRARPYGPGWFWEQQGCWDKASQSYEQELKIRPDSAELWFRLGWCRERLYFWPEAAQHYQRALAYSDNPQWFYRLGLIYEKLGELEKSFPCYQKALEGGFCPQNYILYRLGVTLCSLGRFEQAADFFCRMKPLAHPCTEPRAVALKAARQAAAAKQAGDLNQAVEMYQAAVDRADTYRADWHFAKGCALAGLRQFEKAGSAFADTRILRQPHGLDQYQNFDDETLTSEIKYAEFLDTLNLSPQTIFYESYDAQSMGCNPLAVFRHLLDHPDYHNFTHIWALNNPCLIPPELAEHPRVIFVSRHSSGYLQHMATASYLINNKTFPLYFLRRPGQRYLNTWHGTPLKTLGRDVKTPFGGHLNATRNFLQTTHLISPNAFSTEIMMGRYDLQGLYGGRLAEIGYPRNDLMLNPTPQRRTELRRRLNLKPGEKMVLYAPTWRGNHLRPQLLGETAAGELAALLQDQGHLVFRSHYMVEKISGKAGATVRMAGPEFDTAELLALTDLLITDYSSIFFDFLPLNKPIVFFLPDLEEYEQERGLYLNPRELPGDVCFTLSHTVESVRKCLNQSYQPSAVHRDFQKRFCPYDDGLATERAIDFFFHDAKLNLRYGPERKKTKKLFYAGAFTSNGITASFMTRAAELQDHDQVLLIKPGELAGYPERVAKFNLKPPRWQVLGKPESSPTTVEEKWISENRIILARSGGKAWKKLEKHRQMRAFHCAFGLETHFSHLINYEGYDLEMTSFMAEAPSTAIKLIWLHSDMTAEHKLRFSDLDVNFQYYQGYDRLISVCREVDSKNNYDLTTGQSLEADKFSHCYNPINPDLIRRRSLETLETDLAEFMSSGICLINVARLSPEKGQANLLKAFALISRRYPQARLLILGGGYLKNYLTSLAAEAGLAERVFLAGYRANPWPAVRAAACFVSSSLYEGQGLALLEALVLGVPAIAVDIPANRDTLAEGRGLLTENNIESLAEGLAVFLEGSRPQLKPFDHNAYCKAAQAMFRQLINNGKSG